MTDRPLLLLDVHGVLVPFVEDDLPDEFQPIERDGEELWVSSLHGEWLNRLSQHFDLVWATTWGHDAPRLLAPILGLRPFPVIEFTQGSAGETWKLADVKEFVGDRPLAWLDDDLGPDAQVWADNMYPATLLLRPDPSIGLTRAEVDLLESFGRSHRAS